MRPDAGIALGSRYRLVSLIAVGGMGEVWIGHDESLARDVAVKVLREEFAGDDGFLERFRTEARNVARLSHPNIAQLYDYGEQDGSAFLIMELIRGEPMSDLLNREPALPTRRLLPILAETARALHAAHVAGVVHRDVKPGNILLPRSGRVKITDFGISTAINQIPMTESGMVMGTAQYLSPEQAIGKPATPASDMYSLGIVAYEALVGHRPFTGPTAVDIAVAHVNKPVPPMPPEIDPELTDLVMRMLAKDPELRPRSAASLARVLDQMAQAPTTPISAKGRHARPVDIADAGATGGLPQLAATISLSGPRQLSAAEPDRAGAGTGVAAPGTLPATGGAKPEGRWARVRAGLAALWRRCAAATRRTLRRLGNWISHGSADTSNGQNWSQMSRPLILLLLLMLVALLGAAFADRLWGPSEGEPQSVVEMGPASDRAAAGRGIIDPGPSGPTTTARN